MIPRGVKDAYIGVDVGGTHTDVVAAVDGRVQRGKALTTYDDFSRGVLDAVNVAAQSHGLATHDLLQRTQLFINGTTVVTNSITTLDGARVGVIVTAGFKDTFRFGGGPRLAAFDDHLQQNMPDLVERAAIVEIDERVDSEGSVLASVNRTQLREKVRDLIDRQGVEAVAVCFLNSFRNPANERIASSEIQKMYPSVFVTASHAVFPIRGENRRWTTAVLNCFVEGAARRYVASLTERLRTAGLRRGVVFFQGVGGGVSVERVQQYPLALLGSGPAAGAIGANALARRMGASHVLLGDMGGTSFDTGIIVDNVIHVERNVDVGLLKTAAKIVDVISVGAGGGSVAWIDERGVPRVGPESAGSTPGPAAYGKGGDAATVTDAMVVMGFISPDRYLGGRLALYPERAEEAVRAFGEHFGWSTHEAAAVIHDLVVVNMADAVREVTVEKGHDPREFPFLAYGGTLPLFAAQIAKRLGIRKVVIPEHSSAFCAVGLLAADFVIRYDRTIGWDLSRLDQVNSVNMAAEEMVAHAHQEMAKEGFHTDDVEIGRSGDFRFLGQSYELSIPLPNRALTPADATALAETFYRLYERTYGEGTVWKGVPEELLNLTVTALGRVHTPHPPAATELGRIASEDTTAQARTVFLPSLRARETVPVYEAEQMSVGTTVLGPAIVDATDTTIFVPPETTLVRDEFRSYALTWEGTRE